MLRENYSYEYTQTDSDLRKDWTVKRENRHLLGIGHFNLGWQQKLKGRSALKIEAFYHLPLTGVGHGQVWLRSAGVSVNYLFDFRKK
jgi:hypothetical protein